MQRARSSRVPRITADGRTVMTLRTGPNDLSRLSPGIYFVRSEAAPDRPVSRLVLLR